MKNFKRFIVCAIPILLFALVIAACGDDEPNEKTPGKVTEEREDRIETEAGVEVFDIPDWSTDVYAMCDGPDRIYMMDTGKGVSIDTVQNSVNCQEEVG